MGNIRVTCGPEKNIKTFHNIFNPVLWCSCISNESMIYISKVVNWVGHLFRMPLS